MILQLSSNQIDYLRKETKKQKPIEACAILFGKKIQEHSIVEKIIITKNRLQAPDRFEVDPEKVASAINEAEKNKLEFIGLFHSHPAPAKPSLIDINFMKLWGDAIWLILSTINNNLAAYYIKQNKVKKVMIKIDQKTRKLESN
jgi:proteasome lid subunit RPN8/RPN11